MVGMAEAKDSVDQHVARWSAFWKDDPAFDPEVEGALVRMMDIMKWSRRADAAAFASRDSDDFTLEDYKTLHALMVQPHPVEATPAQLADATHVTRAAMTSRLDRLVAAGLVTREVDPADRRRVLIRATAAGREAWNTHIFEGIERDKQMLGALSREELVQLNALLRKVMLGLESAPRRS
jgi:DNA-binding MarR family transcriptional regulator